MVGAPAEREGAVAVFGEVDQELLQWWGYRDGVGTEGETDAFVGLTDSTGQPLAFAPHDFRRLFITDASPVTWSFGR
ncbi:hypothetical protein [Streptomyces sp. NPDC001507]|uniref:hypothetical protein n=1 Tax=Streptomyces sp. NPDC001507 TaxID=3364579 RepID=UPI0036976A2C